MPEEQVLTFKTEAERNTAIAELPTVPPAGTADVDEWNAEVDAKEQAIRQAQIVPDASAETGETTQSPPTPETPMEPVQPPAPTPDAPPAAEAKEPNGDASEENPVFFSGDLRVGEIPEYLRKYNTMGEILKSAEHARNYADKIHSLYTENQNKADTYQAKLAEEQAEKKKLMEELEKLRAAPKAQPTPTPTQPLTATATAQKKREIEAHLDKLSNLDANDYPELATVRETLAAAAAELGSTSDEVVAMKQQLAEFKRESEDRFKAYEAQKAEDERRRKAVEAQELERKQQQALVSEVAKLQESHPELKTSKPIMDEYGNGVQNDVVKFCDAIMVSQGSPPLQPEDWVTRNRLMNAYLRNDPSVMALCNEKGITPELVGSSKNDIQTYAIVANVDSLVRGHMIDEATGKAVPLVNEITRAPVSFPSHSAAYRYLLDRKGITKKEVDARIADAERRGQQSLGEALEKRDTSPKMLGNAGAADPNATAGVSKEKALEVVNNDTFLMAMEREAIEGDRTKFEYFNECQKALGRQEEAPDPTWPEPRRRA